MIRLDFNLEIQLLFFRFRKTNVRTLASFNSLSATSIVYSLSACAFRANRSISFKSRRRSLFLNRSSNCLSVKFRLSSVNSWRRRSKARLVSWRKSIWFHKFLILNSNLWNIYLCILICNDLFITLQSRFERKRVGWTTTVEYTMQSLDFPITIFDLWRKKQTEINFHISNQTNRKKKKRNETGYSLFLFNKPDLHLANETVVFLWNDSFSVVLNLLCLLLFSSMMTLYDY